MGDEPASAHGQYGLLRKRSGARQNNLYFREFALSCINLD